jgi:hypothetical protein
MASSRVAAVPLGHAPVGRDDLGDRPSPPQIRRAKARAPWFVDAPDDGAIGEHVIVLVLPLAGSARGGGAFEDKPQLSSLMSSFQDECDQCSNGSETVGTNRTQKRDSKPEHTNPQWHVDYFRPVFFEPLH